MAQYEIKDAKTADIDEIYFDKDVKKMCYKNAYGVIKELETASGGSAAWGSITGTLSTQTDLQSALNAKQNTLVSGTSIKTINGSSILGSGNISTASVNPTSIQVPYNNGGVFADSGIEIYSATSPVPNKSYSISTGLTFSGSALFISPFLGVYSFGDASASSSPISASGGAAFTSSGSMVMGCGISNPEFGVFNADGPTALIRMGTTASRSIGVSNANNAMHIGSNFSLFATPVNPTTPVKWVSVTDESSNTYYLPLYQ